jgi:hypothetical protein
MAEQECKLEHGLQVMLDILRDYLGNNATRAEWLTETQKRFTNRNRKLRRGWSDDSIDRKIKKTGTNGIDYRGTRPRVLLRRNRAAASPGVCG